MAKTEKDARLIEYKDTISQLNMTIKSQNEIILSLKDTIASNQEQMRIMTEKIEYLTGKLFGASSEKTKNLEGQYNLFDEAEQEALPAVNHFYQRFQFQHRSHQICGVGYPAAGFQIA